MKIGTFTTTNSKGQIVIPKAMRDALSINRHVTLNMRLTDKGIYIYPVDEFITKAESENSYLHLLKKTKGAWNDENWDKTRKSRSKIELKASKSRKSVW